MKLVLDAGDAQQPLGGDVFEQEIVAHNRLIGASALQAHARGDASHHGNAGKAVARRQAGVAHDGGVPRFVSTVARRATCAALLRLPDRANCCVTALNKGPRLALRSSSTSKAPAVSLRPGAFC